MAEQIFDPIRYKEQLREGWDTSAAGWARWFDLLERGAQPVSEKLVELAKLGPGNRVLDIATGIGEPAVTAARRVGPSGRVVAIDQAPEMLAIGRERVTMLGLSNIEFREADMESLPPDDSGFNAVLSRWGLMFVLDLDGALKRIHQLINSGGRFATAVWGHPSETPMISVASDKVREIAGLPPPIPGTPDPHRFADTTSLERALVRAGFHDVHKERVVVKIEFESPDAFVAFREEISYTFRSMLHSRPLAMQEQIRAAIRDAARKYARAGGVVRMNNVSICLAAQK